MAKQIIVTQNNYGILLETQFIDDAKNPIDLTGYSVTVEFEYLEKCFDVLDATIINAEEGRVGVILEQEHTTEIGLYKTQWSVVDDDENVTAQEDIYYFVKAEVSAEGNEGENQEINIDAQGVVNKFKKLDETLLEHGEKLAEIAEARGGENSLGDRLDGIDKEIMLYNNNMINMKIFGAKGDGFTDDTKMFHDCIEYALLKDKGVFIPNGTYMIDEGFVFANSKQHINADKKIMILGESANGVKIEKISPITTQDDCAFNVCNCKYVQIENVSSSTYQPVKFLANNMYFQGFTEWGKELKDKDIILKNCVYTGDDGVQSPYIYINTPSPKSWDRYSDGNYAKYPIQINNNSGYNAIDINNFSINDDGTAGSPEDKGAIGVVDYVNNSNAVFFCDMKGRRSFTQYIKTDAEVSSSTKPGCVFEVHHTGHIGIGCSTDENATEAQGWDGIKLRDKSPSIAFFDVNDGNRRASINMAKQAYGEEFNFKIDGKGMSIVLQNDGSTVYNGFRYTPIINGLKLINENTVADGLILGSGNEEQVIYLDKNGVLRLGYTYFTSDLEGARFQCVSSGDTGSRPILTAHWRDVGFQYFDTTLNKPIWWNGTKWVDAIGQNV